MSEETSSAGDALDARTDDGMLHVVLGLLSGVVAWFLLPIAGILTTYSGYRLLSDYDRTLLGGLYAAVGTVAVTFWIGYLLSVV